MRRTSTHPGELLLEEFLRPSGETPSAFAKRAALSKSTVSRLIRGLARVSARVASRLAYATGTSEEFWMNAQRGYDETAFSRTTSAGRGKP